MAEFRAGVERALEYAAALDVPRVNCLAGRTGDRATLVENLRYAAERFAAAGRTLLVEHGQHARRPRLPRPHHGGGDLRARRGRRASVKLQFDVYHAQVMEGDLVNRLRALLDRIGHVQVADNPGRHQPGTGEIDFGFVLAELDAMGYDGTVGLEYLPEPDTLASLAWLDRYRVEA